MTGANDTQVDAMTRDTVAFIDTTVIQANAEVARCMARLASSPFIPYKDHVSGFVYDVTTGRLNEVAG